VKGPLGEKHTVDAAGNQSYQHLDLITSNAHKQKLLTRRGPPDFKKDGENFPENVHKAGFTVFNK
jgi:hypothetical protein